MNPRIFARRKRNNHNDSDDDTGGIDQKPLMAGIDLIAISRAAYWKVGAGWVSVSHSEHKWPVLCWRG